MKKYLISLDKDSHRRELFFTQANTQDFDVFSAINTMDLELSELDRQFDTIQFSQHYQRNVTKGEIGCTLSHFSVYQKIVDNENIEENEYSLICEDDALFSSDFEKHFSLLLEQNLNSDIILLGQSKIEDFNHFELEINYPTTFNFLQKKLGNIALCYPYKNYFAGTVAYLIKKSAARKLVEYVTQQKLYWLADDFILYEKKFGLDIQIIRPLLVIENPKLNSNLQAIRGSESNNLFKKLIKYPLKKVLAIQRNLGK